MKHYNKNLAYRKAHWTNVQIYNPRRIYTKEYTDIRKKWCWDHPSDGRFFFSIYTGFWFEKAEDATLFILRWQ